MKTIFAKHILCAGILFCSSHPAFSAPAKPTKSTAKPTPTVPPVKPVPPGMMAAPFELPFPSYFGASTLQAIYAAKHNSKVEPFKKRGIVYLPKGCTNVALNQPVTASDENPKGSPPLVTDGKKEIENNTLFVMAPKTQWIQIDLQKPVAVRGILLWHYWYDPYVYHDVVIQLADDADFTKNVRTVFNNDDDNSAGCGKGKDREYYEDYRGKWIPVVKQIARFVRLYSRGSSVDAANAYSEVEVWATPVPVVPKPVAKPAVAGAVPLGMMVAPFATPKPSYMSSGIVDVPKHTTAPRYKLRGPVFLPIGSSNVALHKPVTASDEYPIIGSPALATDGEKDGEEGHWVGLAPGTQWIQIDLQNTFPLHGFMLWHYPGQARIYRDVIIQLADDADFTKNKRTVFNNDDDNSSGLGKGKDLEFWESYQGQWIAIKVEKARYVRFYSNGSRRDTMNEYTEVEVWATPASGKIKPSAMPTRTRTAAQNMFPAQLMLPP